MQREPDIVLLESSDDEEDEQEESSDEAPSKQNASNAINLSDSESVDVNQDSNSLLMDTFPSSIPFLALISDEDEESSKESFYSTNASSNGKHMDSQVEVTYKVNIDDVEAIIEGLVNKVCADEKQKISIDLTNDAEEDENVESITCEVLFPGEDGEDASNERCDHCGNEIFQVVAVNRKNHVLHACSEECASSLKLKKSEICRVCHSPIDTESVAYMPRFGQQTCHLCSDKCLLRYEADNRPNVNCKNCFKPIKKDVIRTFHWQTYDFCSTQCIMMLLKSYGTCTQCKGYVSTPIRGKYAVRFGNAVRQFCNGNCLDGFKKRSKTCTFCQVEVLDVRKVVSSFGDGRNKRMRDFCGSDCLVNYREVLDAQAIRKQRNELNPDDNDFCHICACLIDNSSVEGIKVKRSDEEHILCSVACVAAFRFKYKVLVCYCDNCARPNISTNKLHMLTAAGKIKIFCTQRCITLFVLKTRSIVACSVCKVKKYSFDLIEEFIRDRDEIKTYCSVQCLQTIAPPVQPSKSGIIQPASRMVVCDQCRAMRIPKFHLKSNNQLIKSFCSQECVNSFKTTGAIKTINSGTPAAPLAPSMLTINGNLVQIPFQLNTSNLANILPRGTQLTTTQNVVLNSTSVSATPPAAVSSSTPVITVSVTTQESTGTSSSLKTTASPTPTKPQATYSRTPNTRYNLRQRNEKSIDSNEIDLDDDDDVQEMDAEEVKVVKVDPKPKPVPQTINITTPTVNIAPAKLLLNGSSSVSGTSLIQGTTHKIQSSNVLIKERPTVQLVNTGVQVRLSSVSRGIMCGPDTCDASCQTENEP